jgi:hypothetical protein
MQLLNLPSTLPRLPSIVLLCALCHIGSRFFVGNNSILKLLSQTQLFLRGTAPSDCRYSFSDSSAQSGNPPFAQHMTSFLAESFRRGRRPQLVQSVMDATGAKANVQYQEDIAFMANIASESKVPFHRHFYLC